jgi:acyl transferase domain-containing protein
VDSGQSSGLVAVQLAAESLRRGEAELAIVAGVNLILTAGSTLGVLRFGALSPDGVCHTFDERANGYARGEGGVVVVLKPLTAARRDGDRILCTIIGGAVNNDGGTERLTTPDVEAQEQVIRAAHARAGVTAADLQYVELHGTGTRVGDPVEAAALGRVFGGRAPADALRVGSVKTNIGHLEGAAGLAGLAKTALSLAHRRLPASLHFARPHPGIPLERLGLRVQHTASAGPRPEQPLLAGVSSFGMGGTNCHLVLAADPDQGPAPEPPAPAVELPWLLSAREPGALRAQAAALVAYLREHPAVPAAQISAGLATTRTHHPHRASLPVDDRAAAEAALAAFAAGDPANLAPGTATAGRRLAVTFTGQGSQRAGMGHRLYAAFPAFRAALDEVCAAFGPLLDRPLFAVLTATEGPDATLLQRTDYAQAALFALETAQYRLVTGWGLVPSVLLGHSIGEITAAHCAGVLTVADAAALVAARGRAMAGARADGVMIAVQAAEDDVRADLAEHGDAGLLALAAVNGPEAVVISGDEGAARRAADRWTAQGRRTRALRVSHAFHSPHMDAAADQFERVAETLTYHPPAIPVVSNVTGLAATAEQLCSASYWAAHVRGTVRFLDGIRAAYGLGADVFLELGPDATLTGLAARCLPRDGARPAVLVAAVRPGRTEEASVAAALGQLHVAGVPVDWRAVHDRRASADLPTYAFQHQRYWLDQADPVTTPAAPPATWADRLATAAPDQRRRALLDLVMSVLAGLLGVADPADLDPGRTFRDAGLDSATGVELRDRLAEATGLRPASSLIFDCPTPADIARHLDELMTGRPDVGGELRRLTGLVEDAGLDDDSRAELADGLVGLLARLHRPARQDGLASARTDQIGSASDDEIFALIDHELGDVS